MVGSAPAPSRPHISSTSWSPDDAGRGAQTPKRAEGIVLLMLPVTEREMRETVRREVSSQVAEKSLIVDEFVIGELGRIDIAAIGSTLVGYEIKSDLDTLARLPRQMDAFNKIFDYCTLVVTDRHLEKARKVIKRGWGLAVVRRSEPNTLFYDQIRKASPRRGQDKVVLAELLWREELIRALDTLNAVRGFRSATRPELAKRLASLTGHEELRGIVSTMLTERRGWRDAKALDEGVARLQYANVSSRFLARRLSTQHR
ncbi:sce7726 family protein [Kocuria sp. CPCC 205297]|uniref:sce7726 family protein n=1 Tax=Kocuria sp. CPCC 205297 TaxID=3073558 RepID=UPI0034D474BB